MTDDDDLRQLRDALRGVLGTAKADLPHVPDSDWRQGWPAIAELGVTALCVPEERGGFGLEVEAAVTAAREFGGALHASPYAGLTAGVHALSRAAEAATDELVAGIIAGTLLCSFGVLDASGRLARVDGVPGAEVLVLVDRAADDLVVLSDAATWTVASALPAFDVTRSSADVRVDPSGGLRIGATPTTRDLYRLLLAADALGCVERMVDRTVAYAAHREAFGRPIAGFQAVQHRLVDHAVRARGMALVVTEAARLLNAGSPAAARMVALAEVGVSSRALHILHDLVQLTGAIGFTWEYGLHFYERRVHHDAWLVSNPRAAVHHLALEEGWASAG